MMVLDEFSSKMCQKWCVGKPMTHIFQILNVRGHTSIMGESASIYVQPCLRLFLLRFWPPCGLWRFTGGLQWFIEKPIWFLDKPHQGFSNAPTLKCFGQKFAEISGFEIAQNMPPKPVWVASQGEKSSFKNTSCLIFLKVILDD